MTLELSRQEAEDLAGVLELHLSEFHDEISGTDRRDLRVALHATWDRLQNLKRRVDALIAPDQPHA